VIEHKNPRLFLPAHRRLPALEEAREALTVAAGSAGKNSSSMAIDRLEHLGEGYFAATTIERMTRQSIPQQFR
jgi:hypothetical protein